MPGRRRRGSRRGVALAAALVVLLGAGAGGGYLWKVQRDHAAADRAVRDTALAYLAAWRSIDESTPPPVTPNVGGGGVTNGDAPVPPSPTAQPATSVAPAALVLPAAADPAAGLPSDDATRGRQGPGAGQAGITAVTVPGDVDVPTLIAAMADMRDRLRLTDATFTPGEAHRAGTTATVAYTAALRLADEAAPWPYSGKLSLAKTAAGWKVRALLGSVHPQLAPGLHFDRTGSTARRGELLDRAGQPLAADPELAGNLIGQVSPPTGLQRAYDDRLAASGGQVVLRDARGAVVRTPYSWTMADGDKIRTTVDLGVQRAAEQALATSRWPAGALVAVDVRTGGILAAANHPLNGFGRALRGTYPPGSTFKIVTATAALMNGRDRNTPLDCSATASAGGRSFSNAENEKLGPLTLRDAFARSCNTAFINLAGSLPPDALAQAARLYGFDGNPPLPIASVGGFFPTPKDAAETASASIGQGRVAASPMQMASVAAAVASGTWRAPFVVGGPTRTNQLPPKILPDLRAFMRAVITDGTAAGVPFPGEVFGKTGTAEYIDGNPPPTHAWFVGYRGPVAFAVLIENGGFGAESAAPVAAAFLNALDGNLPAPTTAAGSAPAGTASAPG
ncbi:MULTISPECIES: penicillin-binding transpeptidase domain-containing protein [unclassified Pseudofrankia]|uniref:penicillin-binding transpeptidase domain-containing protein n=1 Tax=unclassified Pseudofrankia TaxID=2994372 RepID=UPI0009F2811E|nr:MULTISPECIES: penicillin-binding transpeptidase domain-containing protein [unclassified Pseudofrankia]MDT3443736.1 penicillin-binding transpeptidase domain-containing protein [Pseudofrankia sp. BMG5.37]